MILAKHQRLAGKPSACTPPLTDMSDLFDRKRKFIEKKDVMLKIELINATENHQEKEFVNLKISICDEIRLAEVDKYNDLRARLQSIYDEIQADIERAVMEEDERKRELERLAREDEERELAEKLERERREREAREQEERERLEREREAQERLARAQEAAAERRRKEGLLCI